MIESMVTTAAQTFLVGALNGKAPSTAATWNAVCLGDMGDTGVTTVNVTWAKLGKWVHLAKTAYA